jgi:hypothetical protein
MINEGVKYISLKSIADDVYSMIPDVDFDEEKVLEWAAKGYRKLNLPAKYEDKTAFMKVEDHRGTLPVDLKYINQIFFREFNSVSEDPEILELMQDVTGLSPDKPFYEHMANANSFLEGVWENNSFQKFFSPLRRYDGHFDFVPCTQDIPRQNCTHQYVYENDFITTSFRNGCCIISYKAYVKDCDGIDMIPDDEVLKDAIFHFVMYRYFLSRSMIHEQGSERHYTYHQSQYSHLGKRAVARLNMPTIDGLENIKNLTQRLVPRSNLYDSAFSRLSNRENNKL